MSKQSMKSKVIRFCLPLLVLGAGIAAAAIVIATKPEVAEEAAETKPRTVRTMEVKTTSVSIVVNALYP